MITYAIFLFDRRGFRPMELVIGGFVSVIGLCYLVELMIAPIAWGQAGLGVLTPYLPSTSALIVQSE